jgi:hypothetical protein
LTERAVSFAPSGRVIGVLSEPGADRRLDGAPAVLTWNVGVHHRVGPYRVYVDLARRLSEAGFVSLRFDLSGLGDSEIRRDACSEKERALDELHEAMAFVTKRTGIREFVAIGFCSSVDAAHQLALRDPRIVGACFVEGYTYRTFGFYLRRPLRLLSLARWHRLVVRHFTSLSIDEAQAIYQRDYPTAAQFKADYDALVARGVRMLFVYCGDSSFNHRGQFFEALGSRALVGRLDLIYYPHADHILYRVADRARFVDDVCSWMKRSFSARRAHG